MTDIFSDLVEILAPAVECDDCDCLIDTAKDKHYLLEDPWGKRTGDKVCENCRERRWDRYQEKLMEEQP